MASITSVAFTAELRLNATTPQLILTDTTDYASQGITAPDAPAGIISATGPAGLFYNNTDFGAADVPAPLSNPVSSITIALPLDQNNNLLQGAYSITYTVRVADLTQASETTNKTINYSPPTTSVAMSVDLGAPLLTSDDQTGYTIDLIQPTITRDHDIFYPASFSRDPVEGTAKVVTTNVILVTPGQTVAYTSPLVSDLSYDYGDGITVTDQVTGNGQLDITGNEDICQLYCCLNAAYDRYLQESASDTRRAQETRAQLELATSITFLLDSAIRCGKTEDINGYVQQVRSILDCTDDCGCGDEPQLVVGINSSTGTVTVVAGPGITVTSVSGGGTTEYTVSFDATLLSKLNALFNTAITAGTNITLTQVVDGDGNITYTINAVDQSQNAAAVPITSIPGITATNVQEALEALDTAIDTNVTNIATNTGNISTNTTNIGTNTANIGVNTAAIAALTATDIDTSPITGVSGTNVQAMLESLDSNIDSNTTNITTNTGNISTNTGNISTNTTNIGTNTSDIAALAVPAWVEVSGGVGFNDTWNNNPDGDMIPVQYRVDRGALQITGSFRNTGTPASDLIFTLPVGFRPSNDTFGLIHVSSGTAATFGCAIDVTTGNVQFSGTIPANAQGHFTVFTET